MDYNNRINIRTEHGGVMLYLLALVAGIIFLIFLSNKMISDGSLPSFEEYIASSTKITNDFQKNNLSLMASTTIKAPNGIIYAYIASSSLEREIGLSGTENLRDDEAMLFVLDRPGIYPFWMKDMRFSLDIVWIGPDNKVISVDRDVSPDTYPITFQSISAAGAVLELNTGKAESFGLRPGVEIKY